MENNNAKLPKLTVDVFNKGLRRFYRWAAIDADGIVCLYPEKPTIIGRMWSGKDEGACFNLHFDTSNWQNSLIENPAFKEEETRGEKMKQFPKLTVDVFDHPVCPEWAQYAAVDKNGDGFVFSHKPTKRKNEWFFECGVLRHIGSFDPSDWRDSLIERPAAKSEAAPEHDDVKAPYYYINTPFGLEVIEITKHYDFCTGNALKYIFRHGKKVYDGLSVKDSAIKDLRKAIQNLEFRIKVIEEDWNDDRDAKEL